LIVIIGAGGLARECAELCKVHGSGVSFVDDVKKGEFILGTIELLKDPDYPYAVVMAVGDIKSKVDIVNRLKGFNVKWATVIDPTAIVRGPGKIGRDVVVQAGCNLISFKEIGDHTYINMCAGVYHDCVVGEFCQIAPYAHLMGNVTVGDRVLIGASATVLQGLTIGDDARIGAGAVVTKDVPAGETWVGVPARKVER